MPIDYKKYPPNWLKEIRPRILDRDKHKCKRCGVENYSYVWSVKFRGKSQWFKTFEEADQQPKTMERRNGKRIPNPKKVKIILTVAHLDHDEENWDIKDERLEAMCQKCHLTYDGKEKYRRSLIPKTKK